MLARDGEALLDVLKAVLAFPARDAVAAVAGEPVAAGAAVGAGGGGALVDVKLAGHAREARGAAALAVRLALAVGAAVRALARCAGEPGCAGAAMAPGPRRRELLVRGAGARDDVRRVVANAAVAAGLAVAVAPVLLAARAAPVPGAEAAEDPASLSRY